VLRPFPQHWHVPVLRLVRFGLVGIVGFGVNEGLLYLLHGRLLLPLSLANLIAIESAIICNYLLNDRWTFHHPRPALHRFLRFNAVSLVSLVVNFLVVQLCTHFTGLHYLKANALGVLLAFGVNYALNVYWAYGTALRDGGAEVDTAGPDPVRRSDVAGLPPDPA
jgi:putative flippase GtrA